MITELIEDVRVVTTKRTPSEIVTTTTREVRLRITDGPEIVTGSAWRPRRYVVDLIKIRFKDGKLDGYQTYGGVIKKDGTPGSIRASDYYDPDGTRWIYRDQGSTPDEIMDEVARWV